MAQQIPCDICSQTTADFIVTAISNGDTLGVGIECLKAWADQLDTAYRGALATAGANDPATDGMPDRQGVPPDTMSPAGVQEALEARSLLLAGTADSDDIALVNAHLDQIQADDPNGAHTAAETLQGGE